MLLAFLAIACASCQTKPPEPIVVTKVVKPVLPPECRKETPALSPKPDRDMPQTEVFDNWSSDRTARNIGEARRRSCVAAVDAASPQ